MATHEERLARLMEQRRQCQKEIKTLWLRVIFLFDWDLNTFIKLKWQRDDLRKFDGRIAKIKRRMVRRDQWVRDNPDHPFSPQKSH